MKKTFIPISIIICLVMVIASSSAQPESWLGNFNESSLSSTSLPKYWSQDFDNSFNEGTSWYDYKIHSSAEKIKSSGCGLASAAMVLHPREGFFWDERVEYYRGSR